MLADLRDPVLSSFPSLTAITPMMLGAALATAAYTAGRIVVMIFLAMTIALGGWLTGQWIAGGLDTDALHPGNSCPPQRAASSVPPPPRTSTCAPWPKRPSASGSSAGCWSVPS
jgi:hypothetical protein